VIFRPELAAKIVLGKKTATRRGLSDNPRSPWWRERSTYERGQVFAVQPGRGVPRVAEATITRVKIEPLHRLLPSDARREGFATRDAFIAAWRAINGSWNPDQRVHVIEFELAGEPCPHCNGAGGGCDWNGEEGSGPWTCGHCFGTGVGVSDAAHQLIAKLERETG
jgi:hypothetical protein